MDNLEIIDQAKQLTSEFLTQLGLDAEIEAEFVEENGEPKQDKSTDTDEVKYLKLTLLGDHLAELIGFKGRNLDSLQIILGTMLSKKIDNKYVRLLMEINDYRANRESYLQSYAKRAAADVLNSGQKLMLPPMRPHERRVIHLALRGEQGIVTTSEGSGSERRVVISKEE